MLLLPVRSVTAHSAAVRPEDHDLQTLQLRVSAEFREMPGLTLTVVQAARLFSIDAARCERVLRTLVDRGLLVTDGRVYARADVGVRCA
jgi:hypothetical protein